MFRSSLRRVVLCARPCTCDAGMASWNSVYDVLLNTVIPCLHTVILKQVDLRLRIVSVPAVHEEVRNNGVETEKNRDKSSNCDIYVTCDDVRCFL